MYGTWSAIQSTLGIGGLVGVSIGLFFFFCLGVIGCVWLLMPRTPPPPKQGGVGADINVVFTSAVADASPPPPPPIEYK